MGPSLARTKLPGKRCNKRQARRHSGLVRKARLALPVAVAVIASGYVVMATPQSVDEGFVQQFANLDRATEEMRMEKPRFLGADSEGRPYEVSAFAAEQIADMPGFVALDNPEAFKDLGTMGEEYIKALSGLYSTSDKTIDLRNNVRIRQAIGDEDFLLTTEVGKITIEDRTFSSDVKVYGRSKQGTISAEGMTAYQDEKKVVFRNAHMRYNVDPDETALDLEPHDGAPQAGDAAGDNGDDPDK